MLIKWSKNVNSCPREHQNAGWVSQSIGIGGACPTNIWIWFGHAPPSSMFVEYATFCKSSPKYVWFPILNSFGHQGIPILIIRTFGF